VGKHSLYTVLVFSKVLRYIYKANILDNKCDVLIKKKDPLTNGFTNFDLSIFTLLFEHKKKCVHSEAKRAKKKMKKNMEKTYHYADAILHTSVLSHR
jgi:hypothetical protein